MTPRPDLQTGPLNRRKILAGGGVVAATAALVTVLRGENAHAFQATPIEKAPRYKDSPHVQRFYALNRR